MSEEAQIEGVRPDDILPSHQERPNDFNVWDAGKETYPGQHALYDIERAPRDDTNIIVARHAVLRCLVEIAVGRPASIGRARRAARMYLAAAPERDALPLRRLLGRRTIHPAPFYRALLDAGLAAHRAGHSGGAFTLLRWAYEVARQQRRRQASAHAAAHLATIALADGAPSAARQWSRRVGKLLPEHAIPGALAGAYVVWMEKSASGGGYDAAARRHISDALGRGGVLSCPVCHAPLTTSDVRPSRGVPYVRRRLWVLCTGCRRTAAVDMPGKPPTST